MTPPRPRKHNLPANLTFDTTAGTYRYTNPLTKKKTRLGKDRDYAIKRAELRNKAVEFKLQQLALADSGTPTVTHAIDMFMVNVVPFKPWKDSTRKNNLACLRMYQREFGAQLIESVDRIFIGDWLEKKFRKPDTYNGHRHLLGEVWKYAISKGWCQINEPLCTLERSMSLKLEVNQKERLDLTLDQYWQIHAVAEPYLKRAMEISLVTLQSRLECCRLKDTDYRDGWLYFIREKTAGSTDMAFLRIKVTDQITRIRGEAFGDDLLCPYWVRRRPASTRSQHLNNKPHPFYVEPGYLTKGFAKARDESGIKFDGKPPSFHEVRGLGSRLYEKAGFSKVYIQRLMAHTSAKTTDIYLSTPEKLTDDHFLKVAAELDLRDLR